MTARVFHVDAVVGSVAEAAQAAADTWAESPLGSSGAGYDLCVCDGHVRLMVDARTIGRWPVERVLPADLLPYVAAGDARPTWASPEDARRLRAAIRRELAALDKETL